MTLPAQDIVERLRAATMRFDWADIPDEEPIPAIPLLREAADTISRLTADNEALRKEKQQLEERLAYAYQAKYRCNEDANSERARRLGAEARADALAQEVERLRELVQKAFKDGVLYGTNVDVSDVWQAWLSSKVRAELAAASRPLPLQETEK